MRRDELVRRLDALLDLGAYSDSSRNGLQVEGREEVRRVAVAVDACVATAEAALEGGADLLLVHHGLFWGREQVATGVHGRRLRTFLCGGLNLYAAHLPLDAHPELGNNAELARIVGLRDRQPFGVYHGTPLGFRGAVEPQPREALARRLGEALGVEPRLLPFGPEQVRSVGVVSGGAASLLPEAQALGLDLYLTGEATHETFTLAEEGGVNLLLGGHYATETLGVRAVARWIEEELGLPTFFVDHPSGF